MSVTASAKLSVAEDGEKLIDRVRRMAAEYDVSERTARRYIARGEVPPEPSRR